MPTTRTAYPRAVLALDKVGKTLFSVTSLWVLMDIKSRARVLPGKSGVTVEGITRGCEVASPASLPPALGEQTHNWLVTPEDLDRNEHVNNARYLDNTQALATSLNIGDTPREFTVCYLAEALLGQQLTLRYSLSEDGILSVDGCRPRTDVHDKEERIFALRVSY
jgi:acyl-ACP thioesterase